jgi:hypothetical protein
MKIHFYDLQSETVQDSGVLHTAMLRNTKITEDHPFNAQF